MKIDLIKEIPDSSERDNLLEGEAYLYTNTEDYTTVCKIKGTGDSISSDSLDNSGRLFIHDGIICYSSVDEEGTQTINEISRDSSELAHFNDLTNELSYRNWLKSEKIFINSSGKLASINLTGNQENFKGDIIQNYSKIDESDVHVFGTLLKLTEELTNKYNNFVMVNTGADYYKDIVSMRDMTYNISSINVISPDDNKYLSTLDLNSYLEPKLDTSEDNLGKNIKYNSQASLIRVGIIYTLLDNDIPILGEVSFSIETDNNLKMSTGNYTGKDLIVLKETLGGSDVTVEFSDGCIRVFPARQEISECIINYCFIDYVGLK